ncbi:MAG TPA: hypothetical protein VKV15_01215 [Bryobacteraceae bacterium]|nr:hypothetical protein [Bryobacteraceae bacterium]
MLQKGIEGVLTLLLGFADRDVEILCRSGAAPSEEDTLAFNETDEVFHLLVVDLFEGHTLLATI